MADGAGSLAALAVEGIPDVAPGDDVAALILSAHPDLRDDDILVVTSKVVSKAEGRVVRQRDAAAVVASETERVVATRGELRIVRTHHGLVLAAAGVDASNTDPGTLVLLPVDPDASARRIRQQLQTRTGRRLAVVISDTAGRPWRIGQTDIAIGAAGLTVSVPYEGSTDTVGNRLTVTEPAVADEITGAANLVLGKTSQRPVAIVRGLGHLLTQEDGPGARHLLRPTSDDLFPVGSYDVVSSRRTVRAFTAVPVPREAIDDAVRDAVTAPAPHHTQPWRFVVVSDSVRRTELLDGMAERWRNDLSADGFSADSIERRIRRGDVLRQAPTLIVPCLVTEGAHRYADDRRGRAEQAMFWLAMGAGIENFLISLSTREIASAWVGSTLFCPDDVRRLLDLPSDWQPAGAIAVGYAAQPAALRSPRHPATYTLER